jgi:hypothetical protein
MTLDVKYLPAEEEAALLRIFFDKVDPALIDKLVAIANDLRKVYPDVLPLPIAPRTLIHIVEHIQHYPGDSVTDIFTKTYNPSSIVEDPVIAETIAASLRRYDLEGNKASAAARDSLASILEEFAEQKRVKLAQEAEAKRQAEAAKPKSTPVPINTAHDSDEDDWDGGGGHMDFDSPRTKWDDTPGPMSWDQWMNRSDRMPPMPFTSPKSGEDGLPSPTFTSPDDGAASPEEEKGLVDAWAKVLENVARLLSSYMGLRLSPFYYLQKHGENEKNTPRRWRAVSGLEEIQYLPEDLADPDRNVSLGRLAHEVWHLIFSRPELIFENKPFIKNMAFQALWWAVEDPRINNLGVAKHPGARGWLEAAYAKDYGIQDIDAERARWARIPLHLQFNYALIYQWWSGRPDPRVVDSRVLEALQKAAKPIRKAIAEKDARRAFEIIRDEIWPIYQELMKQAYDQAMQDKAEQDGEQQDGEKSDEKQEGQGKGQGQGEQGDEQQDQDQQGSQAGEGQEGDEQQASESESSSGGQGKQGRQQQDKKGKQGGKKKQRPLTDEEKKKYEDQVRKEMEKQEKEYRDKHGEKTLDNPEDMSDAQQEKAKKEAEEMRKKVEKARQKGQPGQQDQQPQDGQSGQSSDSDSSAQDGKKSDPSDPQKQKQQKDRLNKADEEKEVRQADHDRYNKYFDRVRKLIPTMRQQLLQTLKQKIRQRTIRGRDSGDLDEDAYHRIPAGDPDIFKEDFLPNKTLYRISLLIDTSGSMDGDKKERAIEGAIMMMEALDKVPGVQFEVVKYDSDPKVLKPYGAKLSPKMKESIIAAIFSGTGSTEAHKALKEAIERIRMGRGDKMIIMVNDGDPDYNFDRDQYRALIKAAKDVDIHGIGLGDQAQLVLDLFPPGQGHWLKDAAEFANNLRNILRKKLLGH